MPIFVVSKSDLNKLARGHSSEKVCLFVGEPNVSFVVAQNPKFHKVSQEEAVKLPAYKAGHLEELHLLR